MEQVQQIIGTGVVFSFLGLMIFAAVHDLIDLTIPNWLVVACFFLFLAASAIYQIGWSVFGGHLLTGFIVLAVTFAMFVFNVFGGGDAKLFAVASLWYGWTSATPDFLVVSTLFGGALTIVMLVLHRVPLPVWMYKLKGLPQFGQPRPAIPYGIAICFGAVFSFNQSIWFNLAWPA